MPEFSLYGVAVFGGVFPALAWLWFWLQEDSKHPEPRRLIALAFLGGMCTVVAVIPIEKLVATFFLSTFALFAAWSVIEECAKYLSAKILILWRPQNDEPIDPVMYMVTTALGFAALENTLFLLSPLAGETMVQTILTGNLRFVGATLLHVFSSAVVGIAMAWAFYKPKRVKRVMTFLGVILASLLHTVFNLLILSTAENHLLRTFAGVWIGVLVVLAALEFVKRIKPRFAR